MNKLRNKFKNKSQAQYLNKNIVFDRVEQMVVRETMKMKYTSLSANFT